MIRPGRAFLRRMIDLSKRVKELHHKVRLNAAFRLDHRWWGCFLPIWNGACSMAGAALRKPQVILTSDASGSWGCGAYTSTGEWFQLALMEDWNGVHITVKELLPIVLGVGPRWKGLTAQCRCDNAAVVAIINSGRRRMDRAMHLMRCMSFFLARWEASLVCTHIRGWIMVQLMHFHVMTYLLFSAWCQMQPGNRATSQHNYSSVWCPALQIGHR